MGDLIGLTYLRLNNNKLTGKIPGDLGKLKDLEYLNLGDNKLTGT